MMTATNYEHGFSSFFPFSFGFPVSFGGDDLAFSLVVKDENVFLLGFLHLRGVCNDALEFEKEIPTEHTIERQ